MTAQEAIKRIKNHNELHSRAEKHFALHITKALNLAVEALEKQIPKKVDVQTEDDREFIDYVCPCCKTTLQQKIKVPRRYLKSTIYKYRFCLRCGQAVDWSDTE